MRSPDTRSRGRPAGLLSRAVPRAAFCLALGGLGFAGAASAGPAEDYAKH